MSTTSQDDEARAGTPTGSRHQMDSRMMWVMMIGCCLAIPLALIFGLASAGGLAGGSPWLIGLAVVLALGLLVVRRRPGRPGGG